MRGNPAKIDFHNKLILAPMVRVGTLPMRLLALRYGADIVYTEELIDRKLIKSKRRINAALGTVDYVDSTDGTIVFRTCEHERGRVVLQLGTNDAERALAVGKIVQSDVAAIDVNMGCPKEFSLKGGMGAALLEQPEHARQILHTLANGLDIPVTCKIRILPDLQDTLDFINCIKDSGISALAVHPRTKSERPQNQPHLDVFREIAKAIRIPIIASGGSREISRYADVQKFKEHCGADSIMLARSAQMNISIFRKKGLLPVEEIIQEYLKLCVDYDNAAHNTKYCVQGFLKELQETPRGKQFLACQTLQQMCEMFDLGDYCKQKQLEQQDKGNYGRREVAPGLIPGDDTEEGPDLKRAKMSVPPLDPDIIEVNIAFLRSNYTNDIQLPKTVLFRYASQNHKLIPVYSTTGVDKLFRSICKYDGKRYTSSFWEKNKRQAEQAAALVVLYSLGVATEEELVKNGSILR